jgi:hypothetical protein
MKRPSSPATLQRRRLKDVVVVAADSVSPNLAARALDISTDQCEFADAILFSDTALSGRFRHVPIARLNTIQDYSRFCLVDLPKLTNAPFVLIVQWDGYVVDPAMWTPAFLKFDYIGAPIAGAGGVPYVGNGGFSLRSRKLLDALTQITPRQGEAEDVAICVTHRERLIRDFEVVFAPVNFARRFSRETIDPGAPTFGFHAAPNLLLYASDDEIIAIFQSLKPLVLVKYPAHLLMVNALSQGRPVLAHALYRRARSEFDAVAIAQAMAARAPAAAVARVITRLEESYLAGQ